jgi:hypothetical protein
MGWTTGVLFPVRAEIFLFATASTRAGVYSVVPAALFLRLLGLKRPGREADHSASCAETKGVRCDTVTPPASLRLGTQLSTAMRLHEVALN